MLPLSANKPDIRESVDSLYRDDADAQYIQYLSKAMKLNDQRVLSSKKCSACICAVVKLPFSSHHDFVRQ